MNCYYYCAGSLVVGLAAGAYLYRRFYALAYAEAQWAIKYISDKL